MNLNTEELNHVCGMINRALEDGMVISITEQEEDNECSTVEGAMVLEESRDRLELVEALMKTEKPLMVFRNNIGRNWIGIYSVADMYMGANDRFVSDYSYDDSGITGGERRMAVIVGETK
jgi:hypothetical protein